MSTPVPAPESRSAALRRQLALQPHPEGGWYREVFRSACTVVPADGRGARPGLTSIDFLLCRGEFSAWHRVQSDEVWHLLEGESLTLWLLPPGLGCVTKVALTATELRSHVVPANWWQAAEPLGDFAYCGATVGPGFDFADFAFGRDDELLIAALIQLAPELQRLL